MAWKGYSSYGKSALGTSVSVSGLDELMAKVEQAGNDIVPACKNAVNAALPIIEQSMKDGANRHTKGAGKYGTGAVYNAIESTPAKQEGDLIYGTVGIDIEKHPEAKHAVFQEYGDGHSPEFPDPFIRPAVDNNKSKIKSVMARQLKSSGVPVDDSNIRVDSSDMGDKKKSIYTEKSSTPTSTTTASKSSSFWDNLVDEAMKKDREAGRY